MTLSLTLSPRPIRSTSAPRGRLTRRVQCTQVDAFRIGPGAGGGARPRVTIGASQPRAQFPRCLGSPIRSGMSRWDARGRAAGSIRRRPRGGACSPRGSRPGLSRPVRPAPAGRSGTPRGPAPGRWRPPAAPSAGGRRRRGSGRRPRALS